MKQNKKEGKKVGFMSSYLKKKKSMLFHKEPFSECWEEFVVGVIINNQL